MGWFTPSLPSGIEVPRLIIAAHEIGHAMAFHAAGIEVNECVIGSDGDGITEIEDPDDSQHHGYLIGLMGGSAGEQLWCAEFGQSLPAYCRTYTGDEKLFKQHQRQFREARAIGMSGARRAARKIIIAEKKRFRQLVEQLARRGELEWRN